MKHLNRAGINPEWTRQFHAVKNPWALCQNPQRWVLVESKSEWAPEEERGRRTSLLPPVALLYAQKEDDSGEKWPSHCCPHREEGSMQCKGKHECHHGWNSMTERKKKIFQPKRISGESIRTVIIWLIGNTLRFLRTFFSLYKKAYLTLGKPLTNFAVVALCPPFSTLQGHWFDMGSVCYLWDTPFPVSIPLVTRANLSSLLNIR